MHIAILQICNTAPIHCYEPIKSEFGFHLLWSCPQVNSFWEQVFKVLNDVMGSPIPLCLKACVLLPNPENFYFHYSYTCFVESVYSAKKAIARTWLSPWSPAFSEWLNMINIALPLKKMAIPTQNMPN